MMKKLIKIAQHIKHVLRVVRQHPFLIFKRPKRAFEVGVSLIKNTFSDGPKIKKYSLADEINSDGFVQGLVSVIIPVYNHKEYLLDAVNSVLNQTYQKIELIIINDGSTDGVEQFYDEITKYPNVLLLEQKNGSLPVALNNAFKYARGEFRTWTSADNLMHPKHIERLVEEMRADVNLGMVYANYYLINEHGERVIQPDFRPHNRSTEDKYLIDLPLDGENLNVVQDNYIGACFLYRSTVAKMVGDYTRVQGIEDYDYWMRINSFFKLRRISENTAYYDYRVHSNSLSANAAEHKILNKVQQLMRFESIRQQNFAKKLSVMISTDLTRIANFEDWEISSLEKNDQLDVIEHDFALLLSVGFLKKKSYDIKNLSIPIGIVVENDAQLSAVLQHEELILAPNVSVILSYKTKLQTIPTLFNYMISGASWQKKFTVFAKSNLFSYENQTLQLSKTVSPVKVLPTRLRVLVQLENFSYGGLEKVAIDQVKYFLSMGIDVAVLSINSIRREEQARLAEKLGIRLYQIERENEIQYAEVINKFSPNILFAHYSNYGLSSLKDTNVYVVQVVHNCYVWFDENISMDFVRCDEFVDEYVCVSNQAAFYLVNRFGVPERKVRVINNRIDFSELPVISYDVAREGICKEFDVSSKYIVVMCGSITLQKNQLLALKSIAELIEQGLDVSILIFGNIADTVYAEEVVKYAEQYPRRMLLTGYVGNVLEYLPGADMVYMPSLWEGWSMALAEVMALGLPVVTSDAGAAYNFSYMDNVLVVENEFETILELTPSTIYGYQPSTEQVHKYADLIKSFLVSPKRIDLDEIEAFRSTYSIEGYRDYFSILDRW